MSPPGVEPGLPCWKVGVVTASPPGKAEESKPSKLEMKAMNNIYGFLKKAFFKLKI